MMQVAWTLHKLIGKTTWRETALENALAVHQRGHQGEERLHRDLSIQELPENFLRKL